MLCEQCQKPLEKTITRYHYKECGLNNIYLDDWEVWSCANCNSTVPMLPEPIRFTKFVVEALVRQETRLDGRAIFFLRRAMGLKGHELAHILSVHRVEVSRWENGKNAINPHCDFKLRMEAIDRVLSGANRRDLLADVAFLIHRAYREEYGNEDIGISISAGGLVAAAV